MPSITNFSALSHITSKVLSRDKVNIPGTKFLKSWSTENELLRIQSSPFPSSPEISSPVISDTLFSARFHPCKSGEKLHTVFVIEDWLHCNNAIVILTILFVIGVAIYRYWHTMVLCMHPLRLE